MVTKKVARWRAGYYTQLEAAAAIGVPWGTFRLWLLNGTVPEPMNSNWGPIRRYYTRQEIRQLHKTHGRIPSVRFPK